MLTSVPTLCLSVLLGCSFTHSWPGPHHDKSVINFDSSVKYSDCHELYQAGYKKPGTYTIWADKDPLNVHCEAGGTLIQRREFGNFSFQQTFATYEAGFGDMPPKRGDFWIGLKFINFLTNSGNTRLMFTMQDWTNATFQTITYDNFAVLDSSTGYIMFVGAKISGDVSDDFSYHNGFPFTTPDKPGTRSCATNQRTGWWYNSCSEVLGNGKYYVNGNYNPVGGWYDGIYWKDWRGYGYSAKFFSMALSNPGPK